MEKQSLESQIRDIYRLYYRDVYHFLIYFTGDRNEAEDLTQEVFIAVLKGLDRFNEQSQMKTWILSIAKHTAINSYRKKKIVTLFERNKTDEGISEEGIPERDTEEREERQQLYAALQTLKPKYRSVIILRGIKEFSVRETADILEWSEGKVKVTYHRGLKMLKEQLSPSWEGGMLREQV